MTILLVEDEKNNQEIVQMILESSGWDVRLLIADNGLDGLALAQAEHPDLVLLDLAMPGLSGEETLRRLKSEAATAQIPVLVVSAKAFHEDRQAVEALGGMMMTKPFRRRDLLNRIVAVFPSLAVRDTHELPSEG